MCLFARWLGCRSLAAVLAIGGAISWAQQTETPAASLQEVPSPVIRVNTRLVLVDVVVTDKKSGQPVLGLQPKDFTVLEKGKPQKIAFFTAPDQAQSAATAHPLPPGFYSNRPEYRSPTGPPTIIVLDAVNTPFQNQVYSRAQLLKFVREQYTRSQRVAVVAISTDLIVLQDFTSDPQILLQAMERYAAHEPAVTRDPPPADLPAASSAPGLAQAVAQVTASIQRSQSAQVVYAMDRRAEITIDAMRSFVRTLGGIPGRKNIIWLSAGFPFALIPEMRVSNLEIEQERRYESSIRDVEAGLANAQVAIYPVDVCGLGPCPGRKDTDSQESMREMARETGGLEFVNQNDISGAVARTFRDGVASYTLGYYPENKKWDRGYRSIDVKLDRTGVEIRHRHGYFAIDPQQEKDRKTDLELAEGLRDAIPDTEIPFDAKVSSAEQGRTRIEFMLDAQSVTAEDVDQGKKVNVDFQVAIFASDGRLLATPRMQLNRVFPPGIYQQLLQQGMKVHMEVDTPRGGTKLRLAVRDNRTGYVGTVGAQFPD